MIAMIIVIFTALGALLGLWVTSTDDYSDFIDLLFFTTAYGLLGLLVGLLVTLIIILNSL